MPEPSPSHDESEENLGDTGEQLKTELPSPAFLNDTRFYRSIAYFMGASLVISLVGACAAFICKGDVPQIFTAVASGIVGGFAGVLVVSKQGG